jgi:hypothetical protein
MNPQVNWLVNWLVSLLVELLKPWVQWQLFYHGKVKSV